MPLQRFSIATLGKTHSVVKLPELISGSGPEFCDETFHHQGVFKNQLLLLICFFRQASPANFFGIFHFWFFKVSWSKALQDGDLDLALDLGPGIGKLFSWKSQRVKILGFKASGQLLNSATHGWKLPQQQRNELVWLCANKTLFTRNKQRAGLGL